MKYLKLLTLCLMQVCVLNTYAQKELDLEKIAANIEATAEALYESEMTSWYGSDALVEKITDHSKIGGYFSYKRNDEKVCIFFTKAENPVVLGEAIFTNSFSIKDATINLTERPFTKTETDYYILRKKAKEIAQTDTNIKVLKKGNLNFIPFIYNGENKVYIITGTSLQNTVILGNDYELNFDKNLEHVSTAKLHKGALLMSFKSEEGKENEATIHNHIEPYSDFITVTDLCTLKLYEHLSKWKNHYVVSKNYVSLYECANKKLVIVTREVFDKMNNNSEKGEKK